LPHALSDLVLDPVVTRSVRDFGEREGGDLHDAAHFALGFVDALGDFAEALGEGFGFALEEVVSGLCAFELGFHCAEGLAGGEDWLAALGVDVLVGCAW